MNQLIQSVCLSMSVILQFFICQFSVLFLFVSFCGFFLWHESNANRFIFGVFFASFLNHTKNSYTMNRLINEKVLIVLSCGRNVKWMCHHFYSFSQRHRACFILHHGAVDFVLIFMSILVAVRSAHKILK